MLIFFFSFFMQFSIVGERVRGETVMAGPKLPNVEEKNQVGDFPQKKSHLKNDNFIKYFFSAFQYAPAAPNVKGELAMVGPVFQVIFLIKKTFENEHWFPTKTKLFLLRPIYVGSRGCQQVQPQYRKGPGIRFFKKIQPHFFLFPRKPTVFRSFSTLSFNPQGELAMTAPKYRGVDDSSKYNPQTEKQQVNYKF